MIRPEPAQVEPLERRVLLAITLPAGFQQQVYTAGFDTPTAQAFAPDGRLFVLEKAGKVRVVLDGGTLLPTPFATLPVKTNIDLGLVGIALHPSFAQNSHLFLYYSTTNSGGATVHRLSRFTAGLTNPNVAAAGSERILLEIPASTNIHTGGAMGFGLDGMLYLGVGDGGVPSAVQNLGDLRGKVLRLNPEATSLATLAPTDNPFYNTSGARKEVFAKGFRNPFSGATKILPTGATEFWVNDVGYESWEEVNKVARGGNHGWPGVEGPSSNLAYVNPVYAYPHNGTDAAITGALHYADNHFPATYDGSYFFADYLKGFIRRISPTGQASDFATGVDAALDLDLGPDGALYYPSAYGLGFSGTNRPVYRIAYVGSANHSPHALAAANSPTSGLAPLNVSFTAAGSTDPDGDALTYEWNFGDGSAKQFTRDVAHTYQTNGTYFASVIVRDNRGGGATSGPLKITVGNRAPVPTITAPTASLIYRAGDTIALQGSATDPDQGALPPSALKWSVNFLHAQHTHGFIDSIAYPTSGSASFTIPTGGGETDADQGYRISLTATDSAGLSTTASIDIRPQTAQLTLDAGVPGLKLVLDGVTQNAPYSAASVVNMTRTLQAPLQQSANGKAYQFISWSDGVSSATRTIAMPETSATYTAQYEEVSRAYGGTPPNLPGTIQVENFDIGGESVAYHDADAANYWKLYRPGDGVDLTTTPDAGGGYIAGLVIAGEWLEYSVNVPTAGNYDFEFRVASQGTGGTFHMNVDGADKTGPIQVPDTGGWQTFGTLVRKGIALSAGPHLIRLAMDAPRPGGTGVANFNWFKANLAGNTPDVPPPTTTQSPFSGTPIAVPGIIEAENFDHGGEGVAYHDTTTANEGGAYRSTAVDLQATTDVGGGYAIGYAKAGEWLEFTVDVAAAGAYNLALRLAQLGSGGKLHVEVDGVSVTGSLAVTATGAWQAWQTLNAGIVNLSAGQHLLRIAFDANGTTGYVANLNWISLSASSEPPPPATTQSPFSGTPISAPGLFQAEDFDHGGEGVAYHDTTTANVGGAYRSTGVDLEPTSDTGGGYAVGYAKAGEWLEYTIHVPTAGLYDLDLRVASLTGGGSMHLEFGGVNLTGSIVIPNTGAWQNWQTLTLSGLSLGSGTLVMRIAFDTNGPTGYVVNLNHLQLRSVSG